MTVQSTWASNYYLLPLLQRRLHSIHFSFFFPIAPVPIFLSLTFFVFSPITEAYHSAYQFVSQAGFTEHVVTRAEYAEYGSNASRKKFRDWKPQESEKEKLKEASKVKGKQREDDRTQVLTRMTKTRNKLGAGTPTTTNMPLLRSSYSSPQD
jgi:hypothetical protein